MNDDVFRREYTGTFGKPTELETAARKLWLRYYTATEEFDRTLPGAWSPRDSESWIPGPGGWSELSSSFARDMHEATMRELELLGIARELSDRIRYAVGRIGYRRQRHELDSFVRT